MTSISEPVSAGPKRSRWQVFTAAPHRVMMFGGVVQLVVSLVLWSLELLGRYTTLVVAPDLAIPGIWVHGFIMLYAVFPFFVFGFLMTTYPRWMNGTEVPRKAYVTSFLLMAAGALLFYLGALIQRGLMELGVAVLLTGWLLGVAALLRVYRQAPATDKRYEVLLNLFLGLAGLGMLLYGLGLVLDAPRLYQAAMVIGLWGFLLPLMLTVAHRMIPFFTENVVQPYVRVQPFALLWMMVAALLLRGVLLLLQADEGLLLVDLPLAAGALYLSLRWGWRRSLVNRLLAMLHIAFSWFALGLVLYTVQDLLRLSGASLSLGRAPLHALAIGFVTAMTLAMVSRVSLGHSGRPLQAGRLVWLVFLGINLTALLRVLGELPYLFSLAGVPSTLLAALLWLICLIPWAVYFGTIHLTPRVDGRDG